MSSKRSLSSLGWRVVMIASAVVLVGVIVYSLSQLLMAVNSGVGLP